MQTTPADYDRPAAAPLFSGQVRSTASVVAIISAIVSFVMSARGREGVALICAVVAIGAGFLGGLRALSPRVSGGLLSIAAVVLGVIATVVALIAFVV
jgi:hypothetical protein